MKKLTAFLLALLVGALAPAWAQNLAPQTHVLASVYDLDSASFIYCRTLGKNLTATGPNKLPNQAGARISTSGSSTTVTSDGSAASFNAVAVGDVLFVNDAGVLQQRAVTARASANSITVNAALDITAAPFEFRTLSCGTADGSGAIPTSGMHSMTFQVILAQENSASTDYQLECRNFGPATAWSIILGPFNDTSTFNDVNVTDLGFDECRIGARVNTDDGGDTGANAEQLTVLLSVRR